MNLPTDCREKPIRTIEHFPIRGHLPRSGLVNIFFTTFGPVTASVVEGDSPTAALLYQLLKFLLVPLSSQTSRTIA